MNEVPESTELDWRQKPTLYPIDLQRVEPMNRQQHPNTATMEPEIEFRAIYIRPANNKSGSFGVHPGDFGRLVTWRAGHGDKNTLTDVKHPDTGERLFAYRPVEGNMLTRVESVLGIQSGQWCRVKCRAVQRGGRVEFWIEPDSIHAILPDEV
jgi:hypothetical protein